MSEDEYLPDTIKYSIWITNPYAIPPKTDLQDQTMNQEGHEEKNKSIRENK